MTITIRLAQRTSLSRPSGVIRPRLERPAPRVAPPGHALQDRGKMTSVDLQPSLQGDLVTLRPLRGEDFEPLFAVASDPLIWEQHPSRDRYRREVFAGYFDSAMESGGALLVSDARTLEAI